MNICIENIQHHDDDEDGLLDSMSKHLKMVSPSMIQWPPAIIALHKSPISPSAAVQLHLPMLQKPLTSFHSWTPTPLDHSPSSASQAPSSARAHHRRQA